MCLDNWTAQWTPYPLVIEGAQIVTNPAVLASLPDMAASLMSTSNRSCDGGREFLSFPQSALTALCRWPSLQDCLTRMVAQLYPVGAGLGNAWFVCETSGRCARCVTFTETEVVCGSGALVPCSYWGFLIGSVFLGRYANGGAVCLFFKEVCPPLHQLWMPLCSRATPATQLLTQRAAGHWKRSSFCLKGTIMKG